MKKYTCRIFALLLVVLFLPSLSFSAHGWSQENGWIIERRKYEEQYNTIIEYTGKEAFALVPERVAGLIVTAIGPYAFTKNTYVTSVMVSDTVSVAGTNAFAGCPNLQKVKFLGETQWHRALFKDCIKLESVNFPANIHTIPEEAFSNCTSLTSLTIPESVWVIEPKAFAGCTGLREIQFMDYVQIQPNSFAGVTATVLYCSAQWPEDKRLNYGGNLTWIPVADYEILSMTPERIYIRGSGENLEIVFRGALSEIDRIEGPKSELNYNIIEKEMTPNDYTLTQGAAPDLSVLTVKADYITNVQNSHAAFSIYFKDGYRLGRMINFEPQKPIQTTPTEPTVAEPPATQPTVTEPPTTEPPVTEPPVTEPPVTEPPVMEPPATEPSVTEPPATEPPATEPPVTEPSQTESQPEPTTPEQTQPTEPSVPQENKKPSRQNRGDYYVIIVGLVAVAVVVAAWMLCKKR